MSALDPAIEARIRDSFARQQAMATIGAALRSVAAGAVEIEVPFADALTQQHGFLHGGVIAMIADTACGYAALSVMPREAAVLTVEFKLNLLAPGKGERFVAAGRVVRPGRKLVVCVGDVFAETQAERKPIALITATMMVMDTGSGLRD